MANLLSNVAAIWNVTIRVSMVNILGGMLMAVLSPDVTLRQRVEALFGILMI